MAKKRTRVKEAAAPPPAERKPELIWVRSPDGHPFWERHPDHPGGEVWVAGHEDEPSEVVQVAKTDSVKKALRAGRLEVVISGPSKAVEAEAEDE